MKTKRQMCQEEIFKQMKKIEDIYHSYNPKGEYLNLAILGTTIMFNNAYYDDDAEFPINCTDERDLIEERKKWS